jgi:dephospho-CoA kinase
MIICLTGMPGSGKTTAAEIFSKRGFEIVEGSTLIKEEMVRLGIKVDPESVEKFTLKMKAEHGKEYFAVMTGEKLKPRLDDHNFLLVGFRSIAEKEAAQRALGMNMQLIVLMSPQKTRFKRLSERKILGIKSPEVLLLKDKSNTDQGIEELMDKADYMISNTGSKKELEESIDELLKRITEVN